MAIDAAVPAGQDLHHASVQRYLPVHVRAVPDERAPLAAGRLLNGGQTGLYRGAADAAAGKQNTIPV